MRAILVRGLIVAAVIGAALIALQMPLAAVLLGTMGGSEGVTRAAKTYFLIRIWSAPLVLANYVVLGWLIGQARARLALAIAGRDQPDQRGGDGRCWCWCSTSALPAPRSPP